MNQVITRDVIRTVGGSVEGYWVTQRALHVRLSTPEGALVLVIPTGRPDFLAQLETVRFALATNDDHEVRVANGYESPPPKRLWATLERAPEPGPGGLPQARASSLGMGLADRNPFAPAQAAAPSGARS